MTNASIFVKKSIIFLEKNEKISGKEISREIQNLFDEKTSSSVPGIISSPFRLSTDTFLNHSRSSLKIQDGCNCVCTYCRIRLARGKSVSLDAKEVIERVQALEKAGQSEVVITTVNISQYSSEYDGKKVRFADLLELILENSEKIGIRISSLYPEIVDEKLARLFENPRICPYFHISVQSGSDSVLAKMKRPYKIEAVYRATELLRRAKGNPFIACDIIFLSAALLSSMPSRSAQDLEQRLSKCVRWFRTILRTNESPLLKISTKNQRLHTSILLREKLCLPYVKAFTGRVSSKTG